jgi:hypothetical protein
MEITITNGYIKRTARDSEIEQQRKKNIRQIQEVKTSIERERIRSAKLKCVRQYNENTLGVCSYYRHPHFLLLPSNYCTQLPGWNFIKSS